VVSASSTPNFRRISANVLRNRPLWAKGPKYRERSSLRIRVSRKRGNSSPKSTRTRRKRLSSVKSVLYRGRHCLISRPSSSSASGSDFTSIVSKSVIISISARILGCDVIAREGMK
jgi:hypothetical protein